MFVGIGVGKRHRCAEQAKLPEYRQGSADGGAGRAFLEGVQGLASDAACLRQPFLTQSATDAGEPGVFAQALRRHRDFQRKIRCGRHWLRTMLRCE